MQKSNSRSSMPTRSLACAKPPSTARNAVSPRGGSPRKASTFWMPAASSSRKSSRNSSSVLPEHVTCASTSMPVSPLMRLAISTDRLRVDPPAPYVTDTYAGSSVLSVLKDVISASTPASVFGGKNSNEKNGARDRKRSVMRKTPYYERGFRGPSTARLRRFARDDT